ncbi:MAG: hypothetical protein ABSF29_17010, partial [Tepidisphaeraceae bacterium]
TVASPRYRSPTPGRPLLPHFLLSTYYSLLSTEAPLQSGKAAQIRQSMFNTKKTAVIIPANCACGKNRIHPFSFVRARGVPSDFRKKNFQTKKDPAQK